MAREWIVFNYLENKFSGYGLSVVHFQLPGFAWSNVRSIFLGLVHMHKRKQNRTNVLIMTSYFPYFLCVDILGTCWLWRDCPCQGWLILRDSKETWIMPFISKPTNPVFITPATAFIQLLSSGPWFPYPDQPRDRYQTSRVSPYSLELTEIIQTSRS